MKNERSTDVDESTKKYLDKFKDDIEKLLGKTENHINKIFTATINPMDERISSNKADIKENHNKINALQVDVLKLASDVAILKDNKDTKQKQEAIEPKSKSNIIAIISIIVGSVIGVSGILFGIFKG